MEPTHSILLCEEDAAARAFLADNLIADGYDVITADCKPAALAKLASRQPDAVICDVNGDTLDLLDAVRQADGVASRIDPDVPLIVLTARADELARVRLYDRGSDDVIAKPLSYPELRARVRALLRRADGRRRAPVIEVGALRIDTVTREVRVGDGDRRGVGDGVRAAVPPRGRPAARVHQARAAARRVGLPRRGAHPHARRARVPAAPQAQRPRPRAASSRTCGASATGSRPSTRAKRPEPRHDRARARAHRPPARDEAAGRRRPAVAQPPRRRGRGPGGARDRVREPGTDPQRDGGQLHRGHRPPRGAPSSASAPTAPARSTSRWPARRAGTS